MKKTLLMKSVRCAFLTCGMKAPNVLVLSRIGEPCGICCDRAREVVGGCAVKVEA